MSVEAVARKWHDQFLRTDPIDHEKAEAAVRAVYRLAGMAEPERFLWSASPLEAAYAVLVLVGKTEGYNHAVLEDVERSKAGKDKLARARTSVAETLGITEEQVEGYFGMPFYRAEGTDPVKRKLTEQCVDAWMAKAEAGDDFLAVHAQGPFKPLHDLEHALHYEGYRFRDGGQKPALIRHAMLSAGGKHVEILGGRSALHRLYGNMAYTDIAVEEALAAAGKFEPTGLQSALWAAYEACGMWWPCEAGVVFAERPVAVEGGGETLAMLWPDGLAVGEIAGHAVPAAPAAPAEPAAPSSRDARVLDQPLPADHSARLAELRKSGALPLLDRYLAGEHELVWKELTALGEKARSEPHAADALAVAFETMHRVAQNVGVIAERLNALDYRFVYPGSGGFFGLRRAAAHEPHVPPPADARDGIAQLEELAGGAIPLSLRAFFEVVGEVNLNGDHPALAPKDSNIAPDPLMVCGIEEAIAMIESSDRDDDEPVLLEFAPDALHKANVSGGGPYAIALPNPVADARVEDAPQDVPFVDYLRIAILQWGGFPGWEEAKAAPAELDRLRQGLIPF